VFIVGLKNADITGSVLANHPGGTCVADRLIAKSAVMTRISQRELLLAPVTVIGLLEALGISNRVDSASIMKPEAAVEIS